ncbi:phosphopantetheine-binding protein [Myceligenerans crystallogenes]|uniref:Carrier domain-containing protein n=1 Tax=Myceligenerans crystallogenes TaxID=316335 RepID=A0ABN2NFS7_9MICO
MRPSTVVLTCDGEIARGDERRAARALAVQAVRVLTGSWSPVRLRSRAGRRPLGTQDGRRVWVSWSHSRQGVAAAASTRPVGVDIEACRPLREPGPIAERLATAGLAGRAGEPCSVLDGWVALESGLKALGVGLALPLRRVRFRDAALELDGRATGLRRTALPGHGRLHHTSVVHHGTPADLVHVVARSAGPVPDHHLDGARPGAVPSFPLSTTSTQEEVMAVALDKEELRHLIADTIDQDVEDVTDEASFTDDLDVDSLMALEVTMVLERRYKVKLKEERLPEVTSLQAAYNLLSEELEKTA